MRSIAFAGDKGSFEVLHASAELGFFYSAAQIGGNARGRNRDRLPDYPAERNYLDPISGLRVRSSGKRLKSRSTVHNSRTPWLRQQAAILAS